MSFWFTGLNCVYRTLSMWAPEHLSRVCVLGWETQSPFWLVIEVCVQIDFDFVSMPGPPLSATFLFLKTPPALPPCLGFVTIYHTFFEHTQGTFFVSTPTSNSSICVFSRHFNLTPLFLSNVRKKHKLTHVPQNHRMLWARTGCWIRVFSKKGGVI